MTIWHLVDMGGGAPEFWRVDIALNTNRYQNAAADDWVGAITIGGQAKAPADGFNFVYWYDLAVPASDPRFVVNVTTGALTAIQINTLWVRRRASGGMPGTSWIQIAPHSSTDDYRWVTATNGWTSWKPKTDMPDSNEIYIGAFSGPTHLHDSPNRYSEWDDIFQSTQEAEFRWRLPQEITTP